MSEPSITGQKRPAWWPTAEQKRLADAAHDAAMAAKRSRCSFCGLSEDDDLGGILAPCEAHGMCCDTCHDAHSVPS